MALYQPTNVIPSSYTKGTVDVNDTMEIAWQVNGNSAMTAFQIDFYLNDYASTPVTSTGKLTDNIPADGFYGTDRFGRPQFFTYNAGITWEDKGFTNGNEYKYKITQWYEGLNEMVEFQTERLPIQPNVMYYFSVPNGNSYAGGIVYFSLSERITDITLIYSLTNGVGWYHTNIGNEEDNELHFIPMNFIASGNTPSGALSLGEGTLATTNECLIQQNSSSIFITRDKPNLTIFRSNDSYSSNINFPNNGSIATSIGFFKAEYKQLQGEPIRWVRWQVATANNGGVGEILADTGDVYTPTLNYEYNGFFNGRQYAIRAIGESESGQETKLENADGSGWVYFNINIENQGKYTGEFSVQCLNKENATFLEWEGVEIISPTVSPQGYEPTITNGTVTLLPINGLTEYSVTWDKQGANPMNFSAPWTAVWKGKIINYKPKTTTHAFSGVTTLQQDGTYKFFTYYPFPGQILNYSNPQTNSNVIRTQISIIGDTLHVELWSKFANENVSLVVDVTYAEKYYEPQGTVFKAGNLTLSREAEVFILRAGGIGIGWSIPPLDSTYVAVVITPTTANYYYYADGKFLSSNQHSISYNQQPITSISIYGGDRGATVDSVSVYQGDKLNILSLYENPDFEPVWNNDQYNLYMTANFNGNLEGGTGTTTGTGFRLYRQEVGKNILTPIATVPSTTTSVKDYGIVSHKAYKYSLYAYDNNGAFMNSVENEKVVATCFKNYSLLVCDYDEENDEYHVRKQYLFEYNLTNSSVSNNAAPTVNTNFTRYPTLMRSTQNYASGTLSGLIGAIYTVPALVEQIGNYKWTAKPSTLDYFDSVDLEDELRELSSVPYQLFLRDKKGHLYMIGLNGAITTTQDIKKKQLPVTISLPWVEIGDASDVTIIQAPDDYGWNNDNQVLDVSLDVDVETGELSATYPFPYNGTKFYLTGANKENLTAKTPLGITPAQFNLSEVATETDDGEVTATVTVNTENN